MQLGCMHGLSVLASRSPAEDKAMASMVCACAIHGVQLALPLILVTISAQGFSLCGFFGVPWTAPPYNRLGACAFSSDAFVQS